MLWSVLFLLPLCSTMNMNIQEVLLPCQLLATKLLPQFSEYDRVIYYNNASLHCLNSYIVLERTDRIHLLMNRDIGEFEVKHITPYNRLHILLSSDIEMIHDILKTYRNIHARDVILMVPMNEVARINMEKTCNIHFRNMRKATGVFLIDDHSKIIEFCNFYYGENLVRVERVMLTEEKMPDMMKFFNEFSDMGRYKFTVGRAQLPPLLYTIEVDGKNISSGIEHTMMKFFAEKVNFTYEYKDFAFTNGEIGAIEQQFQQVMKNKIDWIVSGVSLTYERSTMLDYLYPIAEIEYAFVFLIKSELHNNLNSFIRRLFIGSYYMMLMVSMILLLAFFMKLSEKHRTGKQKPFLRYIKMNVLVLIDQSLSVTLVKEIKKWRMLPKLLILTWWLCSWINSGYLKGALSASLIHVQYNDSLDENYLLTNGYNFKTGPDDYHFLYNWCHYSSSTLCNKVIGFIDITDNTTRDLKAAETEKIAIIKNFLPLQYLLKNYVVTNKDMELIIRNIGIGHGKQTWFFQQSTPYIKTFNNLLSRLHQSGLIFHWFNKEQLNGGKHCISQSSPFLAMSHLSNTFSFLIYGLAISFFVFLMEICMARLKIACTF